jgi:hypothetical protein
MVNPDKLDEPGSNEGRPRGIFTDADRRFLEKDEDQRQDDYSPPARYERWESIKQRMAVGLLDLSAALYGVPKKTRGEIFDSLFHNWSVYEPARLVTNCMGFLLVGLMESLDKEMDDEEYLEFVVERALDRMLWASQYRMGVRSAELNVDITIDGWSSSKNLDQQLDPTEMSPEWLHGMYVMGELTQEEFARAVLSDELEDGD